MTLVVRFGRCPPVPAEIGPLMGYVLDDDHAEALATAVLGGVDRIRTHDGQPGALRRKVVACLSRDSRTWRFARADRAMHASTADVLASDLERWSRVVLGRVRIFADLDEKVAFRSGLKDLLAGLRAVREKRLDELTAALNDNEQAIDLHRESCVKCSPTRMCRTAQRLNERGSQRAAEALEGKRVR